MENNYKHLLHHYLKDIIDSYIKELNERSAILDFNFYDMHSSYKRCTIEDRMMRLITAVIPVMSDMKRYFPKDLHALNWFESKYVEYNQRPDVNICRCIGCIDERSLTEENREAEFGVHPVPWSSVYMPKPETFDCQSLKLIIKK